MVIREAFMVAQLRECNSVQLLNLSRERHCLKVSIAYLSHHHRGAISIVEQYDLSV